MKETKAERTTRFYNRMMEMGLTFDEARRLRRIEKTLSRWSELECGDGNEYASWAIERDEQTQLPYMVRYYHRQSGPDSVKRHRIADREAGALRRLQQIMAAHPGLWFYHQTDPRGVSLYIGRQQDLCTHEGNALPGTLDSLYTRGMAVCI